MANLGSDRVIYIPGPDTHIIYIYNIVSDEDLSRDNHVLLGYNISISQRSSGVDIILILYI